jgi:hypothetical protein
MFVDESVATFSTRLVNVTYPSFALSYMDAANLANPAVRGAGRVGVTALEAEDATESPTLFIAITVNVYDTPFVSPVNVIGDERPVIIDVAGEDMTLYPVIVGSSGIVKDIIARPFPPVAVTLVGELGTVGELSGVQHDTSFPTDKSF